MEGECSNTVPTLLPPVLLIGSLSRICSLKFGVLQGTILGPLLFLIDINDLPNCLTSSQPRMYADDTHITYAGVDVNSIQLNLNHDLDNLNKWLISNKLTLNTAKTEFMLIGSRQKLSTLSNPLELSINNVPIEHVSSVKSLGVFIDENLRWQTHIDKLSKKVASGIGAIKRIRPFVPPPTLHYIYNALIQSHFDYCNLVWGNCGKTLFDRLQKLQNHAAHVLTFSSYDADANLRDSVNKLFVPFPRTNFMKNSFTYSGAVLWNGLPCHVREAKSLRQFKRLVNDHF